MATTAQTIHAMADVIAERGLAAHSFEDKDGRVCVLGALMIVCPPYVVGTVHDVVEAIMRKTGSSIVVWSDMHTTDEAVAMLRAVAQEA